MSFFGFIVYSFFYFVGLGGLISLFLGYSPFVCFSFQTKEFFPNPFADWVYLINEFQWGRWAVDSTQNFIIFLIFILFFPCWILFWFLVRRVRFLKIIKKPFHHFKRKKLEQVTPAENPTPKNSVLTERPKALPKSISFGRALQDNQVKAEESTQPQNSSTMNQSMTSTDSKNHPEPAYTQQMKDFIQQLAKEHSLDLFENVLLGDFIVPIVLATDTRAFLITFLSADTEWIADETISDGYDKPTWFSTQGLITSPAFELQTAAAILKEKEENSELIGIVVLTKGSVLNASLMQKTWSKNKIFVVKYDESIPIEDCLTLADLLDRNVFDSDYMPDLPTPEYTAYLPNDNLVDESETSANEIPEELPPPEPNDVLPPIENILSDISDDMSQIPEEKDESQ